jgi:hypothetical protein
MFMKTNGIPISTRHTLACCAGSGQADHPARRRRYDGIAFCISLATTHSPLACPERAERAIAFSNRNIPKLEFNLTLSILNNLKFSNELIYFMQVKPKIAPSARLLRMALIRKIEGTFGVRFLRSGRSIARYSRNSGTDKGTAATHRRSVQNRGL